MDHENELQLMHGLGELEAQGRMTWIDAHHGWAAAPDDVVEALSKDGFEECQRETTSRQKLQPADGARRGINPGHGIRGVRRLGESAAAGASSVAHRDGWKSPRDRALSSLERDPYTDDGGGS